MRRDIRESNDLFDILSRAAMDAIICIDGDSRILFLNRAAEKMFDYPAGELLGRELTLLMPQRLGPHAGCRPGRACRTGLALSSPTRAQRSPWPDGHRAIARRRAGQAIRAPSHRPSDTLGPGLTKRRVWPDDTSPPSRCPSH